MYVKSAIDFRRITPSDEKDFLFHEKVIYSQGFILNNRDDMSLISIAKGHFLQDDESFEAYLKEDAKYFNRVVDLTGSGDKLDVKLRGDLSSRQKKVIQTMVVGDALWLEPYFYWTDDSWKGRYSRIALTLIESRFRSRWVRKAGDFGELNLRMPDYSIPKELDLDSTYNMTGNHHFESLMQAFSILNLEWMLYVDSELETGVDRERINDMIEEATHFFSTGEINNPELMRMQVQQHRFAADWLENFLNAIDDRSISLERSIKGIRSYADLMERQI